MFKPDGDGQRATTAKRDGTQVEPGGGGIRPHAIVDVLLTGIATTWPGATALTLLRRAVDTVTTSLEPRPALTPAYSKA